MTQYPFEQMPKLLPLQAYKPLVEHDTPALGHVADVVGAVDVVVVDTTVDNVVGCDVVVVEIVVEVVVGGGGAVDKADAIPEMKPPLA